jgi:hypothetical protein
VVIRIRDVRRPAASLARPLHKKQVLAATCGGSSGEAARMRSKPPPVGRFAQGVRQAMAAACQPDVRAREVRRKG